MRTAVIVQTCDRYQRFWGGFLHFMDRHWDRRIGANIYLCNEEADADLPAWCRQIKTGRGTFVENLKKILGGIDEERVFYMLEDFWPIAPMGAELFESLQHEFVSEGWDALQVSGYTPYYSLKRLDKVVGDGRLFAFDRSSKWKFNFQARFWKPEVLLGCLREPDIPESAVGSAITAEMASDDFALANMNLKVALHHYIWYPFSGVSYRGEMSEFGKHLQNIMEIDHYVEKVFS
jgi:hypothetical protein